MLRSSDDTRQALTVIITNDRTCFSSHFLGEAFKPKISSESALVVVQQNNFEFHLYRFYICYCKHFTDLAIKKNNFEFKLDRPVNRYGGTLLPPFPSLWFYLYIQYGFHELPQTNPAPGQLHGLLCRYAYPKQSNCQEYGSQTRRWIRARTTLRFTGAWASSAGAIVLTKMICMVVVLHHVIRCSQSASDARSVKMVNSVRLIRVLLNPGPMPRSHKLHAQTKMLKPLLWI
jgi:hypothetical protein